MSADNESNWFDDYIPSGNTVNSLIGQAMKGFVDVEKAKVGARLNATRPLQSASMNTVPLDSQAPQKSNSKMIWIAGGVAALVVAGLVFAAVKK